MFDIIIRNGTIIDGSRAPRFQADVGIESDRIAAIGNLQDANAKKTIDANNRIVAPGFVDVHNHSDGWLLKQQHFQAKTRQGFTTEVLMADGVGYAPVNEHTWRDWFFYLRALDGLRMDEYQGWNSIAEFMDCIQGNNVQNVMTHIPYANLRSIACGFGKQAVDDFQMRGIQTAIQRGMDEGAVGVSTGIDYIVQCYSTTDELAEAFSAMSQRRGLYVTHVRYKKGLLPGIKEAVQIARQANVPLHISHLKGQSPGQVDELLSYIDNVARKEVDFSFDAYPYQPGSTMLSYLLPYDVWEDGPLAALSKLRLDETRSRTRDGLQAFRLNLDRIRIAWVPSKENAHLQGKYLSEYIMDSGQPAEEALCNLLIEERLAVLLVFDEGVDELIYPILQHDLHLLGTDGIYSEDGLVHPRVYGSAARLLGPLCRDSQLFSLEEAVHKLSGGPKTRFGMKERGIIRKNYYADIVVFDPERVADRATYGDPHQYSVGIETVIVNGTTILHRSEPVVGEPRTRLASKAVLPGRFLPFSV